MGDFPSHVWLLEDKNRFFYLQAQPNIATVGHPYGSEESLEKQDIQRLCVAVEHPCVVWLAAENCLLPWTAYQKLLFSNALWTLPEAIFSIKN